jgi:hypothetical protein
VTATDGSPVWRFWRRRPLPEVLRSALGPDERVAVTAPCQDGRLLAVSRFGLWVVADFAVDAGPEAARRIGWELVARARLTARVLSVIPTRVVGSLPGGVDVLLDEPELVFALATRSGLTDVVHQRVRRSVAASRHLPYPGAGGWVVLRRVPGRDGLSRQVRLDPGADPEVPGFAAAVVALADDLADSVPA